MLIPAVMSAAFSWTVMSPDTPRRIAIGRSPRPFVSQKLCSSRKTSPPRDRRSTTSPYAAILASALNTAGAAIFGLADTRVMDMQPLGDYAQLLLSTARAWSAGTVVHGSRVLDDLVVRLEQFRNTDWTAEYWPRLAPRTAVIGCVPWLTDRAVADALASFDQCCIVVDKQQPDYASVQLLANAGDALSSAYLDGFTDMAPPDASGNPPIIHPNSGRLEPVELGPVRVAGWRRARDGSARPMLHSKMVVLGVTTFYEDDEMFAGDVLKFDPKLTWMGSANWTYQARRHIEFGLWSSDVDLVRHNYDYLLSLVAFSERRGATTIGPEPELVSAVWDDDAFRDYFVESPDPPEDDADDA